MCIIVDHGEICRTHQAVFTGFSEGGRQSKKKGKREEERQKIIEAIHDRTTKENVGNKTHPLSYRNNE